MNKYEIESNIPMPNTDYQRQKDSVVATLRRMAIGDSVLISDKTQGVVSAHWHTAAKRIGMKTATRKVDGGVRVWRTA